MEQNRIYNKNGIQCVITDKTVIEQFIDTEYGCFKLSDVVSVCWDFLNMTQENDKTGMYSLQENQLYHKCIVAWLVQFGFITRYQKSAWNIFYCVKNYNDLKELYYGLNTYLHNSND